MTLQVTDVACPRCKAKAGRACTMKNGKPVLGSIPHMARRDAWWDEKRKAIAASVKP